MESHSLWDIVSVLTCFAFTLLIKLVVLLEQSKKVYTFYVVDVLANIYIFLSKHKKTFHLIFTKISNH